MNISKALTRWGTLGLVIAAVAVLAGCATDSGAARAAAEAEALSASGGTNAVVRTGMAESEVLGVGDMLTIVYNDLPILQSPSDVQIKADGSFTLLLNQRFEAAGLTRSQLEEEIRKRYVPDYFRNMTVTVQVKDITKLLYVGGQVRSPGRQQYIGRTTVLKAIQAAGDFNDWANRRKVRITRANSKQVLTVNASKALRDPAADVEVYPGDSIYVPKKVF